MIAEACRREVAGALSRAAEGLALAREIRTALEAQGARVRRWRSTFGYAR